MLTPMTDADINFLQNSSPILYKKNPKKNEFSPTKILRSIKGKKKNKPRSMEQDKL